MTTSQLHEKYKHLTSIQQQEVDDFIEFLLTRQTMQKTLNKKQILLNISVWGEMDTQNIEQVRKDMTWQIPAH